MALLSVSRSSGHRWMLTTSSSEAKQRMSDTRSKAKTTAKPSPEQAQEILQRLQSELEALARKAGELEAEADEHELVLSTLTEVAQTDPGRKCFRLIGGVLTERTVKDIGDVIQKLTEQYKKKEEEFDLRKKEFSSSSVVVS